MPSGIASLAKKHGLGWGGSFKNYKDASLFSARSEEGGTIPAPRKPEVYKTTETKDEIAKENVEALRNFNESLGGGLAQAELTEAERAYAVEKGYIK